MSLKDDYGSDLESAATENDGKKKPSQATVLVTLALKAGVALFHTPGTDSEGFARVPVGEHAEVWRLNSQGFREWLRRLYWQSQEAVPNAEALQAAIGTLSGIALFDGVESEAHIRVADDGGDIYLDLANEDWSAVRVSADGWQVVDKPTVHFVRPRGMLPLPTPVKGGSLEELREFINVESDADWVLFVAWLVASHRPRGPYPILGLHGEQGSAKSTTSRILRSLVDPNTAPLRSEPKEPRDMMVAASNSWVVAFDNFSKVPTWLSDALCRLSTGGGFSTRQLYSDGEEKIFDSQRPVLLNGITELATRSDLLDRTVSLTLPTIPESKRRTESELWQAFEQARPRILGALLDAVSTGLRNEPGVRLDSLPRMADFARWTVAAEPAFGVDAASFMDAYQENRASLNTSAIEGSIIAEPLRKLIGERDTWTGTASELLELLSELVGEQAARRREWPKRANIVSAELKRIAPNLRQAGVDVVFNREGKSRKRTITLTRTDGENSVRTVRSVLYSENGDSASSADRPPSSAESGVNHGENGQADTADDEFRLSSDGGMDWVEASW